MRRGLVIGLLVANATLSIGALAWLSWIAVEPRYWFPSAYAEKGERGDLGPRGPVGPEGPPGPVGPDAADAYARAAEELSTLAARVSDLEDAVASTDVAELESGLDDLNSTFQNLCDQIDLEYSYAEAGSGIEAVFEGLRNGCP
jgi:hypothetical protein